MPLIVRRIIFYTLLIAFLIAAPVLIARTAGYRWSNTQQRLLKTGALSLSANPENATIGILGQDYSGQTPALIGNLLPGNYEIRVGKDGYRDWSKILQVETGRATFALNIPLFKNTAPQITKNSDKKFSYKTAMRIPLPSLAPFFVFPDHTANAIVVVDNDLQKRVAQAPGSKTVWREKPSPLLFIYSAHEIWQFNPASGKTTLVTRLIEEIKQVLAVPKKDAVILILPDRISALELDRRDRQNRWDLAEFDEIKNASLAEDGKTLVIEGTRESKTGVWVLEL